MTDPSGAGEVRRSAAALARAIGLGDDAQGRAALIATEAATNLVKHAKGGEVVLRSLSVTEGVGLELLVLDRGPGIADLARCLRDGYSTTATAGAGLGAIQRQSDFFDVNSTPGLGTILVTRVHERPVHVPTTGVDVGVVCLPIEGEEACGDGWAIESTPLRTAILVADGLGHGLPAAAAASEAVRAFRATAHASPTEVIHALHEGLRPTRGGAAAVAVIDHVTRVLRFSGIGNIAGAVLALNRRQGLVSLNGTLGHSVRKVQAFEYVWPPGAVLVMHSDGISSHWDLARSPGLIARHPALAAGTIYRDFRRGRDDATALVVRDAQRG